jgi:hypothetical protein
MLNVSAFCARRADGRRRVNQHDGHACETLHEKPRS